jgi:hypothetical protein
MQVRSSIPLSPITAPSAFRIPDDPDDPDLARAGEGKDVTVVAHDAALRSAWRTLPSYPTYRASLDSEVMSRQLLNVEQSVPQLRPFFRFYHNGKSAVRLSGDGPCTAGVHRFRRAAGAIIAIQSSRQFILHYPCCGFDTFWTKYVALVRFADKWWDAFDIAAAIGSFHLEARDVVMRGDRDAALAFYGERVAITDPPQAERLIELGVAARLASPKQIIARARGS